MTKDEPPVLRIARLLRERRRFLICGHVRPDADCVGSQPAPAPALDRTGKAAEVWPSDPVPANSRFLPGSPGIRTPEHPWAPPAGPRAQQQPFLVVEGIDALWIGVLPQVGAPVIVKDGAHGAAPAIRLK